MKVNYTHDYAKEVTDIMKSENSDRDKACKILSLMADAINDGCRNSYDLLNRCKGFLSDPHPGLATWQEARQELISDIENFTKE